MVHTLVTILGFGSLLSPRSAGTTFPRMHNFRIGRVDGWRRAFAHVGIIFLEKGLAEPGSLEVASVAAEEHAGSHLLVSVFEIPVNDYPAFERREDFFRLVPVEVHELAEHPWPETVPHRERTTGVLCAAFARDADLIASNFRDREEAFRRAHEQWYRGPIYRDDILPCRTYLLHCLTAAERLHPTVRDNFLDATVLGDRRTTVRAYLAAHPGLLDGIRLGEKFDRYAG